MEDRRALATTMGAREVIDPSTDDPAASIKDLTDGDGANLGLFDEMSDFVVQNDVSLEKLITHRFSIDQGVEAFELFETGRTGKVVFEWDS
jgi:threonine dehydrogenase-like Zn-dependent dehydrogenase